MAHIDIIIKPSGEFSVETSGFKGEACQVASKAYEEKLGGIENEKLKPEFYEKEQQERVQQNRG